MRRIVMPGLLTGLLFLVACSDGRQPAPLGPDSGAAFAAADGQADRWIVVLHADQADPETEARRLVAAAGGRLRFVYSHAIKGFAATLPGPAVDALRTNPVVAYVEPDAEVRLVATQNNPVWGLDRIDQRDLPLSASYTYANAGTGVNAYILDTGVRLSHNEFGGRAAYVPNGANGDFVGDGHGSAADCHGHGTHVAGTVGGATYGVAKDVKIWAARVVNCNGGGQVSMAIAAVDWLTANAQKPAVANMSLGYGNVQSLRDAVQASIAAGVNYAVAAGNGNFAGRPVNACSESPAGAPAALTVGATESDDDEASFSNYGTCVDILAPGVGVTSAWYTGNSATATISGTSMATPHVAGAAALYLSANPTATPAQVAGALTSNATVGRIDLHSSSASNGTPNRLLFVGVLGGEPGNQPPVAAFTYSCDGLTCTFTDTSADPDGTIAGRSWNFGDGATSSQTNPVHTYDGDGTYTVQLAVTDDDGATDTETQGVTVTSPDPGGSDITLTVTGEKVRGVRTATLAWQGASGTQVDILRDGSLLTTTANDGAYVDELGRGGGSATYRVCEAGTATCSAAVTVTF